MAYTTINKSTEHFDTKVYTGNGSSQTLDMDNLGLLWMKNRTETSNHNLFDSVRGGYYTSAPGPNLRSNGTTAAGGSDITSAYGITFGSSSSTIGSDGGGYNYNQNSKSYVGWQWRAGTAVSGNTGGSGTAKTYTGSVNTTSGFSIIKYTGNGTAGHTIPHHLGVAPSMIITKILSGDTSSWYAYHKSLGNTGNIFLDTTAAVSNSGAWWNSTTPTSSVFTVGDQTGNNSNNNPFIAYCFAEKQGYSKFGSYTGNGNADGTFVYTGFKPAFVMIKRTDTGDNWLIKDIKRDPINQMEKRIFPNLSNAEDTGSGGNYDFLSNGFKLRESDAIGNASGGTYIYMAFAEAPLVGTNNVPCTAR